jgi:hypothetical protein
MHGEAGCGSLHSDKLQSRKPEMCRLIPDKGKRFLSSPKARQTLEPVCCPKGRRSSILTANWLERQGHQLLPLRIFSAITHHGVYRGSLRLLFLYSVWGLRALASHGWSFFKAKYGRRCFGVWQFGRESRLNVDYVSRAVLSFLLNTAYWKK